MKRLVKISIDIDTEEYLGANDSPLGTIALVEDILKGYADYPINSLVKIDCGDDCKTIKMNEHQYKPKNK